MMNLSRMATDTGLPLAECRAHRIDYLREHVRQLADDVSWFAQDDGELSHHFCLSVFGQLVAEAKELHYLFRQQRGYKPPRNEITTMMIDQARNYPVEQLIEFDQQGKALAFCHADNHPSLSWHRSRNRCTCFVCGKSFNSIDILVERDGCTFQTAVRQLAA